MKLENKMKLNTEYSVLCLTAVVALFSGQLFLFLLVMGLIFIWEDAQWTAFDSDNYDEKMMRGSLKPWNKGN